MKNIMHIYTPIIELLHITVYIYMNQVSLMHKK